MAKVNLDGSPKEKKPKARKPIHPGIEKMAARDVYRCLGCSFEIHFLKPAMEGVIVTLSEFSVALGFCACGMWVKREIGRYSYEIRWIRFSSGEVVPFPGGKELNAP